MDIDDVFDKLLEKVEHSGDRYWRYRVEELQRELSTSRLKSSELQKQLEQLQKKGNE